MRFFQFIVCMILVTIVYLQDTIKRIVLNHLIFSERCTCIFSLMASGVLWSRAMPLSGR